MKLKTLIVISVFMFAVLALPSAVSAVEPQEYPEAYVVTTDYYGNSYYMAYNPEDGTFDDMVLIGTTSPMSRGNAIGDFDGDGDYDFVVSGGLYPVQFTSMRNSHPATTSLSQERWGYITTQAKPVIWRQPILTATARTMWS